MRRSVIFTLIAVAFLFTSVGQVDAQKTKIVWAKCSGTDVGLAMFDNLAKQYMAENPNVEVSRICPTGSYYNTLLTWIAGGVDVDVMWLGSGLWSFTDLLLPLDELVAKDRYVKMINPSVLNSGRWDGKQIGLPYGVNANVVAYNKNIFASAGVAYPTSNWLLSDIVNMGKRIIRDENGDGTIDRWGISPLTYEQSMVQGGDFYSTDLRHAKFVTPASIEATQFIADLNNGKFGVCYPQVPSAQRDPMFYNQKTAMYAIGTFFLTNARLNAKFDWDVVPFPGLLQNGVRYDSAYVSLESWAVNKNSKNPEVAKDFVAWLLRPEAMTQIVTVLGNIIPTQPQQAVNFMNQPAPPQNLNAFVKTIEYIHRYYFDHPAGTYIGSNFLSSSNPTYNNMLGGKIPAAMALPEIEKQINAYLDEWWAKK